MRTLLLLTLLLFFNVSFAQVAVQPSGSGTSGDPYLISNLGNLYFLSQNPTYYSTGKFIKQTADIDASETSTWFSNGSGGYYGFPIIGGSSNAVGNHVNGTFSASYDGQGFKISNLYINRSPHYVALFGYCSGATIKNLLLQSPTVIAGNTNYSGNYQGIAIFIASGSNITIQNINISSGNLTNNSGYAYCGGMLGRVGVVNASDCSINATITVNTVLTSGQPGMFLGLAQSTTGSYINCFASGSISSSNCNYIGGFVGAANLGSAGPGSYTFTKCGSTANVSAANYAGGFAGQVYDNTCSFTDCYATGNVTSSNAGGFYAYSNSYGSNFTRCYSSGVVTGSNGGGFGYNYGAHIFTNCFWDNQNSGRLQGFGSSSSSAVGLVGSSTANMKIATTFTNVNWNFSTTWDIAVATNNGYPFLRSNGSTLPVTWQSFTATKQPNFVELNWSTASEQNSKDFEVQYSTNTQDWSVLGTVVAAGNSSTTKEYNFMHNTPLKGSIYNYYRIKQNDLDGKFSYSKIVSIIYNELGSDVMLYPNPVRDVITVFLAESQQLRLLNMAGATVWQGRLAAGRNQLSVSHLPKGVYVLQTSKGPQQIIIQ